MRAPGLRRLVRYALVPPALFLGWLLAVWPPPAWYRTHWPAETAFMHAAPAAPPRRYRPVPLDSISATLVEAVLIAEDARFRQHRGIDWVEVRKAVGYRRSRFSWSSAEERAELWDAVRQSQARHRAVRGASTVTQQLAKNLYLSPSRNPLRKLKEAVTAYRLELALGKERILELYLNVAEFGPGIWGAEAASRRYFRAGADRLTLTQSAALAATLPFPRGSNPGYRPVRMRRRQDLILRRMRGERIEVPKVEEEPISEPGDSIQWTPGVDSLLDSLRAPVETLFTSLDPRPLDPGLSFRTRRPRPTHQSTNRSGITSVR